MKHLTAWIIAILCTSAAAMPGRTATLTEHDEIISRIDSRMAALDSLIFKTSAPAASSSALATRISCPADSIYAAAVDAVVDSRIDAIKAQTGVQLTGQTYYRADGALGFDDDDEAVSRYTGKIQAEARWYFLQSGLLKRTGRINEERLKGDIDVLQHERGRAEPAIYAMRERLRTDNDSLLASVMLYRVDNLALLEEAYMHLLGDEKITSDELIKILDDRAEAERWLSTTSVTPTHAPSLAMVNAATVKIDIDSVLASLAYTDIDFKLLDMKSQLLDIRADNTTWWSDVRIAPFARYSHYFRHALPASSNVDVGVSFTIPINTDAAHQRATLRAEKGLLECQRDDMMDKAKDRVKYIVLETDRLNRGIAGEWERAASLRRYLQERRKAYDHRIGEYNRLAALKEYNSYIRSLETIVEMQYKRDALIADLQSLVPHVSVLNFCTFTPLTYEK